MPLRVVTVTTADLTRTRRFYQGALSMDMASHTLRGAAARSLAAHWGLPGRDTLTTALFRRETIDDAVAVRVIVVDGSLPTLRPGYDSRIVGPLGIGFPVEGLQRRLEIAAAFGFETTAGAKIMALSMSGRRICSRRPSLPTAIQAHGIGGMTTPSLPSLSVASVMRRPTSSS